ncbi:MAG TPA: hypothetical protein P5277_02300 [Candidatus Paceibacterota bacterium]|nr:hypothetical protein [Candidatus Paceibacterota bacterium]
MYKLFVANSKTEKRLSEYIHLRNDIKQKLDYLKEEPRKANGAHPLHGILAGKWACWLGSNIRAIYTINDEDKIVIIEAVGAHNIYK